MKGFFRVQTPAEVYEKLIRYKPLSSERVRIEESLHRVLAEDIASSVDLPPHRRSIVDGFAVKAKDTYGASEKNPAILRVVGDIPMGKIPGMTLRDGEAARIATGGLIPEGSDGVEMIEFSEILDSNTVQVSKALSPLENIIDVGEDVHAGENILSKGHRVRPQDAGLMAGIGKSEVVVHLRPKVGIISSGDEIVPIEKTPEPGEIRDINRYTIAAMVQEARAIPIFYGTARDRFEDLREKIETAQAKSDMVVVTGGSSVGSLDLTSDVLRSFSETEILVHGISIRPGKPTLLADLQGKPFLGLPGHPVSAMVIFHFFGKAILKILSGLTEKWEWERIPLRAKALRNIPSVPGREDYVRVRIIEKRDGLWADPVFGKSGAISNLVAAEGLLRIDINDEGLEEGEESEIILI